MTHSLRKRLLSTAALLGFLSAMPCVHGWDEAAPADADNLPGVLPQVNDTDGKIIYNIPTLKQLWESQAVINASRDKVAHIALDEEVVFVQSSAGVVTAMNAESGRRFWSSQVGRNDEVAMKGSTDSQMVVIVVGPVIHAFDKFSGYKLFSFRLPNPPSAAPLLTKREVTTGNRTEVTRSIFVPLADRSIVAYDVDNLQYQASRGTLRPGVSRALDWRFAAGEIIRFAPVAGQERLAFATEVGNIHVMDMTGSAKGKTRFQFLMNSPTTAPLAVVNREDQELLLAACDNNRLFCINLKTDGGMLWTVPMARAVYEPITVVGDDVFVVSDDDELRKFDLRTGLPVKVSQGVSAVASRTEGDGGELPAYGAAVELRCRGLLSFEPITVINRSTGQTVNSLVVDLSTAISKASFAANELEEVMIRIPDDSRKSAGVKNVKLSADRKQLTIDFSDFNPDETFEFYVDLEHIDVPFWKITHNELVGADVKALVSPVRLSVVATAAVNRRVEPFPPRTVLGRFRDVSTPWFVSGVKSLVAVSENAAYFVDKNDRVVAVSRLNAGSPVVTPTRDFTIHVNNTLTDRVYLSTAGGRVACFTESRIQVGALPVPLLAGLTWIVYPQAALAPDFARYHRNPEARPIMPDVPELDPAPPAAEGDAVEMP